MTRQSFRLHDGGIIDRDTEVGFRFDGKDYKGYRGDTLASALIASGEHMVARSFKYHRPRGIVGAGSEDPAGLVAIGKGAGADPNTRVTEQEIWQGLEAFAQNCWPSLKHDVNAVNDLFSRFFSAGFYYKTFIGPPGSWMTFEPMIRHAAGMGITPDGPDPDAYESINRHCDVLVAGAGPAGLMAALSAARAGARVIIAEETANAGGQLLSLPEDTEHGVAIGGERPRDWVAGVVRELEENENVTFLTRTAVAGYYADNFLALWEKVGDHLAPSARDKRLPRQRLWRVRAKEVVLATGAVERALVFNQNDRPGVMLASAARTYLHRYAAIPGHHAVIVANNDNAWSTAFDLHAAGVVISAVVDSRPHPDPDLTRKAAELNIPFRLGFQVVSTSGRHRVNEITIESRAGVLEGFHADLIAMSGGWSPNVSLFSQSRGQLRYDEDLAAFRPGTAWQRQRSAGSANGTMTTAECFTEGARAGAEAATAAGFSAEPAEIPAIEKLGAEPLGISPVWKMVSSKRRQESLRRLAGRRQGRRSRDGRARGLPLGRARQALHHHGHGHRSGQDLQHERLRHPVGGAGKDASRTGDHHVPPALEADHLRRPCRSACR